MQLNYYEILNSRFAFDHRYVDVKLNFVIRLTCENVTKELLALQGSPNCEMNQSWPYCVPLAIGDRGVAGMSALQACCRFGGGNRRGLSFTMSQYSPMYCTCSRRFSTSQIYQSKFTLLSNTGTPSDDDNSKYAIQCGCSSSDESRVDLQARECRDMCPGGHYFYQDTNIPNGTFLNKVGVCIMCKPGKFKPYMKLFE